MIRGKGQKERSQVPLPLYSSPSSPTSVGYPLATDNILSCLGDTCCNPLSLGRLIKVVQEQVPGIYTRSIQIGNNFAEDAFNGFFKNANEQIEIVCKNLTADENLKAGFNVIGFSQGGQFW